eukprot:GILK01012896.1.p3 GENE.GILK01012896.1~~GILK01012896.1.p3  ORF type:complete len:108 (+),score=11.82 GILK01012896.1:43-324(+)
MDALEDTDVPNEFLCPITHEVMETPVIASDRHCYERRAIKVWFRRKGTSPLTREHLNNAFIPDIERKNVIQAFLAHYSPPRSSEEVEAWLCPR